MQPFIIAEKIKDAYRRYIETSFPIRRDALRQQFARLVDDEQLLWQEAYISLARPFKTAGGFQDLIAKGLLAPQTMTPHWDIPGLWEHQSQAARRLSTLNHRPVNTIVATGTGSGKTEAFMIPIVDHCLRHPGPGVEALIIYPMNALINDQLKRLRRVLAGTGVTFARYTGDTPESATSAQDRSQSLRPPEAPDEERYYRSEISASPPQILLTNYSMLEYLLLRKSDQKLFQLQKPRYLVLDEVHTFVGVLGAEVACLIRRFKEHCGLDMGELTCVGTSATIQDPQDPTAARQRIVEFATELFAESFDAADLIEEVFEESARAERNAVRPAEEALVLRPCSPADVADINPDDPECIRRLAQAAFGLALTTEGDGVYEELYEAIASLSLFDALENHLRQPRPLSALLADLAAMLRWTAQSDETLRATLSALFLLGCAARRPGTAANPEALLKPKVHLFVRSVAPLHLCLDVDHEHLLADGQSLCDSADHARRPVHAPVLVACRSCGADYRQVHIERELWESARGGGGRRRRTAAMPAAQLKFLMDAPESGPFETLYLGPAPESGTALAGDTGSDTEGGAAGVDGDEEAGPPPIMIAGVCPTCLLAVPAAGGMLGATCPNCGAINLPQFAIYDRATQCPRCGARGRGRRPEILLPLRSGAAPSIAVLAQTLLPALDAGEKKFLVFADSRQDTAHQAGYLRDRHQVFTQRQLVYRILQKHEAEAGAPIALPDLANEVFLQTRALLGNEVQAFNLLRPIRRPEDVAFLEEGQVITNGQRTHLINQLHWDLALEFTHRATDRYSLEREGLCAVSYAQLRETAEEGLAGFARFGIGSVDHLETLLRAALDTMRTRKAVDYRPFRDFLEGGSDDVRRGIANPTMYVRTPVGFDWQARKRQGAFDVKGFISSNRRASMEDWLRRAMPELNREDTRALIEATIKLLESKRYLVRTEIGKLSVAYGRISTQALQVAERVVEVTSCGERVRCQTCGVSRSYLVRANGGGEPVCLTYGCPGHPQPYTPDPDENFYVRVYSQPQPERLYPMEHSGQISGPEREKLEAQFAENKINALVCTPTLELGVNIGDLSALILRNVPPTPSNYAQRAGRAGRRRRIALILSHAGQGPHDAYFFGRPEEMIAGAIRPPVFLLDNRAIIDRHLNSLILEKLAAHLPGDWLDIRTDEGFLREEVLPPFVDELAQRGDDIWQAVARAFVRDQQLGGLQWLTAAYAQGRVTSFVPELRAALERWCSRWRGLYEELRRSRARVRPSDADRERERRLSEALDTLEQDQQYRPLSFLGLVGFLPRYGFPGATVAVRDEKEREITQGAAVGLTEYAPGNRVYVGGRKLRVDRVLFRSGLRADPRQNAEAYRYCQRCNYASTFALTAVCPYCHEPLQTGRYVDYEAAGGRVEEAITQEDEYRRSEDYLVATYLAPREGEPTPDDVTKTYAGWDFAYSRLRKVELYNQGLHDRETGAIEPFTVCLECGMWREPRRTEEPTEGREPRDRVRGHLPTCTVNTWDAEQDDRVVAALHLRAQLQGDVIEIPLSQFVAEKRAWVETFAGAWLMGLGLEYYVRPGEIRAFRRDWEENGHRRASLVLYDTMPGGTGYLKRVMEDLPRLAARIADHLEACDCEQACYRCLKDYWNQRVHSALDKRLVLRTFRAIAEATAGPSPRPLDDAIRFDSFLESQFYALLEARGLPLPTTQVVLRDRSAGYIMRADFVYETQRLVILTDGQAFHARDPIRVVEDLDKRNGLILEGKQLLEFTYWDVVERAEEVVTAMRTVLASGGSMDPTASYESSALTDTAAAAFVERLHRRLSRFQAAGRISLAGASGRGNAQWLPTVAADPERGLAVVTVDIDAWCRDPQSWRRELALHNRGRLQGWRLIRVPSVWLVGPQGGELIERVARSVLT